MMALTSVTRPVISSCVMRRPRAQRPSERVTLRTSPRHRDHNCPYVSGTDCHRRARFPWSLAYCLVSVGRISHYVVIRVENSFGSRGLASDVTSPVRHGVNQPFVAQHADSAPRRSPGDLEL